MARKLYSFPWYLRPDRDEAWFENERTRLAPDAFAREILINYDFSATGTVFQEFCEGHILEVPYQFNPDLPVYRAVDFGRTCAAVWAQRDSYGRFVFFREVILEPSSTTELAQTVQQISYEYASHAAKPYDTCDPAGNTISFTANHSDIKILNEYDIFPKFDKLVESKNRLQEGVSLIKHMLSQRGSSSLPLIRVCRKGCPKLIESFQSGYRYKVNKSTGETMDIIEEKHPYEDVMDCLRYILMQFSYRDIPTSTYTPGVTKFIPTKNPSYKPVNGLFR